MPVFISARLRDELDKMARRLGGKRMSASGIVENMVKHHLTVYGDELLTIPSMTLLKKNSEGGCKRRKRSEGQDCKANKT